MPFSVSRLLSACFFISMAQVAQEGEDLAAVAPDGAEASEPAREEVR